MENTAPLRNWLNSQITKEFDGNLSNFSEKTKVSRQTWMNVLNQKYSSLRQQAVSDLCSLFELSEIDLYLIAHPQTDSTAMHVREEQSPYPQPDDEDRLAKYLRTASIKDRDFIFNAAERCGFSRRNNSEN